MLSSAKARFERPSNVTPILRRHSLKTRLTLAVLAVFVAGIWSTAFYVGRTLRADIEKQLCDQQFAMVSVLADEMDQELRDRIAYLEAIARPIDARVMKDSASLQAMLDQRPILPLLFNAGVMIHSADGTAIADTMPGLKRIGVNYIDTPPMTIALREGRSNISGPTLGRVLRTPVFVTAVPVLGPDKEVIGALSAVVDLGQKNFLDTVVEGHYGASGTYMLVAKRERQVIVATDKRLALTTIAADGSNPLIDRFVAGFEGSGITVNPLGIEILGSAKGIPTAGWYLAVATPTEVAFAPLRTMERQLLVAALVLTLLVGALIWWIVHGALAPMVANVGHLAAMSEGSRALHALPVHRHDEVGQMIGAFNHVLQTLDQRETELRESEGRYRAFFEASPDAITVHREGRFVFANQAAARLFHADSPLSLLGRDWHEVMAPEDWDITEQRIASLAGRTDYYLPVLDRRYVALDGSPFVGESTAARIVFDGKPAILAVIRDVTERRQAEQQRLDEARKQRDALVREVHHRIKNNLQSVAGLLRRQFGDAGVDPRVEAAVAQVHAIATAHGLQGAAAGESIRLCDSVRSICESLSGLTNRPIDYRIEDEHGSFRPIRIDEREAVYVALVINELVLNAVKHSPAGCPAPTVSLQSDGQRAVVEIRNTVNAEPHFDIANGQGIGTGLGLVRSLLPGEGAELTFASEAPDRFVARLRLTAPVVVPDMPN